MTTCRHCRGKFRQLNSMHTLSCMGLTYDEYCAHYGLRKPQLGLSSRRCEVCGQRLAVRGAGRFCAVHDPSRPAMARPFYERYEEVQRSYSTPCWEWTGSVSRKYGVVQWRGRQTPAHRAFYEWHHQTTVPLRLHIDHLCRNTRCVNPAHLEPVTPTVNNKRKREGRYSVVAIFEARKSGSTLQEIADRFKIDRKTVTNVLYTERYADLREQYGIERQQTIHERVRELVPQLLADYASGMSQRDVATKHNVDVNAVTRVVNAPEYETLRQELGIVRPSERVSKEDRLARDVYLAYRRGAGSMYTVGCMFDCAATLVHRVVNHHKFAPLREQLDQQLAQAS